MGEKVSKLSARTAAIAAIVLGLLGVIDAGVLTYDHQMAALGQVDSTVCEPGSGCAAIQSTAMSSIPLGRYRAKLPIALLGMACYLVVIGLGVGRLRRPSNVHIPRLLLTVGILSTLYSFVLFAYSLIKVGTLCPYCVGLYIIALALLAVGWLSAGEPLGASVKGLWAGVRSSAGIASVVVFIVLTGAGYAVYSSPINAELSTKYGELEQQARELPNQAEVKIDVAGRPFEGPKDAPIHIVEFADYECPHCGGLYKMLHEAAEKRPGKIRITMMNFPLSNVCNPNMRSEFHTRACLLAYGGECAHQQGRWKDIAAWLYDNGKSADAASVLAEAKRLGMDGETFDACLKDPATKAQVLKDIETGVSAGVEATPTFFINGRIIEGGRPPEVIDAALDAFLARSKK